MINNNDNNIAQQGADAVVDRIIESVDAGITLYRQEPSLPLQDTKGGLLALCSGGTTITENTS
jgi:hypothetical protein